jgi:hypothetical protein
VHTCAVAKGCKSEIYRAMTKSGSDPINALQASNVSAYIWKQCDRETIRR